MSVPWGRVALAALAALVCVAFLIYNWRTHRVFVAFGALLERKHTPGYHITDADREIARRYLGVITDESRGRWLEMSPELFIRKEP